jgi:hypothetical protein
MDYELWDNFFPGRLHTTREIIFFLQNIKNTGHIVENESPNIIDLLLGDITHPHVYPLLKHFLSVTDFTVFDNINIEISSRKLFTYKDRPFNYHYSTVLFDKWKKEKIPFNITSYKEYKEKQKYIDEFVYKELTDDEIIQDIITIKELVKTIFNNNATVNIISQINLKLKETNHYIPERNSLVCILENACNITGINFYNPGKYIELLHPDVFMNDYVMDNQHFNSMIKYHETIKMFRHERPSDIDIKKVLQCSQQHNRI